MLTLSPHLSAVGKELGDSPGATGIGCHTTTAVRVNIPDLDGHYSRLALLLKGLRHAAALSPP